MTCRCVFDKGSSETIGVREQQWVESAGAAIRPSIAFSEREVREGDGAVKVKAGVE